MRKEVLSLDPGACPRTPGLWTLPELPRPVDGAETAPPTVRLDGSVRAAHSSLEYAKRVSHSAHRPDDEIKFNSRIDYP
jgi:hypothetical protein